MSEIRLEPCDAMEFWVARGKTEREAAARVMGQLYARSPGAARAARLFYVERRGLEVVCGVAAEGPAGAGTELLRLEPGEYAVLEGPCRGDGTACEETLTRWVRDNGFAAAGPPFTLYEAAGGFAPENIAARAYIPVKTW